MEGLKIKDMAIGLRYGRLLLIGIVILGAIGSIGIIQRLGWGHEWANYGSYIPWGLWVGAYTYFIGLSSGSFLLSSLIYVFRIRVLEKIGIISLITAIITLFLGLISIWFDLGHMELFYHMFTRPNFNSIMAWIVWFYTAYFILLILELYLAFRVAVSDIPKSPSENLILRVLRVITKPLNRLSNEQALGILRVLGILGILLVIALSGGGGALFGTIAARPMWHNPAYPIFFIAGALISGGGLLMAIVAFLYPMLEEEREVALKFMGRVVAAIMIFELLLEWAEFSIPMWYGVGEEIKNLKLILFGPFWWVFWIIHLLIGSAVPLILIFAGRKTWQWGLAGFLIASSFIAVRLNIVIPGLVTPVLHGLEEAFVDHRLRYDYVPSISEWLVYIFLVAVGAFLIYIANLLLVQGKLVQINLKEETKQ